MNSAEPLEVAQGCAPAGLETLCTLPQWTVGLLVWNDAKRKHDKIPVNYQTGIPCNAHEPGNWTTYDTAAATAAAWGAQFTTGFVLTAADDLFCLDIDHARQPDGSWSPLAVSLVQRLPGCMVEISQSGEGLHVWGRYPNPPAHACKRVDLGIELYTERRFIAIGTNQVGEIAPRCDALPALIAEFFPPIESVGGLVPDDGPSPDWRGPADDDELLRRALQSRSARSAFGVGACFADLWEARVDVLARAYPSASGDDFDRSSVDAALAQMLAFWTGRDAARIERLMQRSALKRDKWERPDYLPRTIATACTRQRDVLQDKPAPDVQPAGQGGAAPAAGDAPGMAARGEAPYLTAEAQAGLFAGCVYVIDQHKVLTPKSHDLLSPERFKAVYGGYVFAMDTRNERTTRNAFEAFTESQVLRAPSAEGTCFRPDLPYGEVVTTGGRSRVNTWRHVEVPRVQGDPSPFLVHLGKLLPDERDRAMLLYYLANMVQLQGRKFQFAPLIVGTPGNGKTFLSRCIDRAIGEKYTAWPRPERLGTQFNSFLVGRTAYLVEDAFLRGRDDLLEVLKPMITGTRIEVEAKGVDQDSTEICGNWLFNANRRDSIRKTADDRRYMVLWCAQQTVADLERDGMTPDYFDRLYRWAEREQGYAIVAEYLHTLAVPAEFGLSWVMGRAPRTSATAGAIEATRSPVEQEILEAVEQDLPGFRGGWISSVMLRQHLERCRRLGDVSRSEYPALLDGLGYVRHPALRNGQVDNVVLPDGKKPQLYVLKDGPAAALQRPGEVAAAYVAAQMGR